LENDKLDLSKALEEEEYLKHQIENEEEVYNEWREEKQQELDIVDQRLAESNDYINNPIEDELLKEVEDLETKLKQIQKELKLDRDDCSIFSSSLIGPISVPKMTDIADDYQSFFKNPNKFPTLESFLSPVTTNSVEPTAPSKDAQREKEALTKTLRVYDSRSVGRQLKPNQSSNLIPSNFPTSERRQFYLKSLENDTRVIGDLEPVTRKRKLLSLSMVSTSSSPKGLPLRGALSRSHESRHLLELNQQSLCFLHLQFRQLSKLHPRQIFHAEFKQEYHQLLLEKSFPMQESRIHRLSQRLQNKVKDHRLRSSCAIVFIINRHRAESIALVRQF
jgi:hypothetical protein